MGVARQFWLFVVPLLIGFSAAGLLVFAALFPEQLFPIGSAGYVATGAVAVVSLGVLVWRTVAFDGVRLGGLDGSGKERP